MKLIFRYDDFGPSEVVSFETDQKLFAIFRAAQVPLLVGVTPRTSKSVHDPSNESFHDLEQDQRRIALLDEALKSGWQLALHGYTHQKRDATHGTEFAGQPRAVQYAKLENGQAILRRCFPDTPLQVFIPPWNSFDSITIGCADDLGFRFLSGGELRPVLPPTKLWYVPTFFETRNFLDYLQHYSLDDLARVAGDAWIVVTLHAFDFDGSGKGRPTRVEELAEALRQVQARPGLADILSSNEVPVEVTRKQERILKGKLLLGRRSLGRYASDSRAQIVWKLRGSFDF